ncbi:pilus assembly protein [Acidihalobacter yilgarnensis]|uniref:pilus assembly protein n=1 Tax=Acidihalobacter yilgarnensis TaxID=2819280 RepID=UPI0009F31A48|nr:PilC/PilY family type IV pilus protein [Acidihalobacter yilgarnensis]
MKTMINLWLLRTVMVVTLGLLGMELAFAGSPQVQISNIPMTLVQPTPPQVLFAVTNSQSMDGDLSGAIMTGSGAVNGFSGPSSPTCYTVPAGFTPPMSAAGTGGCPSGQAPYTVISGSVQYDNGPSRLNVAKQALHAVIQQYAATFDMGLMEYKTGTANLYSTWVYYMSPTNGFAFTNDITDALPSGATSWVTNPCYGTSASSQCTSMASILGSSVTSDQFMAVQSTSDSPEINDVLYASGLSPIFLDYGSHSPSNPYTGFSLSAYNQGSILISYKSCTPSNCAAATGPTNAGYVPYSDQVIYASRGFGYYTTATPSTGTVLVQIQNAGINGQPATSAQINKYINNFTPYLAPETNNTTSKEIKALAVQSPIAGILAGAYNYFTNPAPPTVNGCPSKRYVVLVTDGLPTEDTSGYNWPPLGSEAGNGYGVYATFDLVKGGTVSTTSTSFAADVLAGKTLGLAVDSNGNYLTNDQALIDAITNLKMLVSKGITTYVVGMGAGVDPSKNPAAAATMKAMAIAGGTPNYFAGTSAQAVVNDLSVIFGQIQAANMSTTSVAVNSGSIQNNTLVFQARFTSATAPYNDWTGNLLAFPISSNLSINTQSSNAIWQAEPQLDKALAGTNWQSFPIYSWNPTKSQGVAFDWSNIDANQQADLEQYWSTLTSTQQVAYSSNIAVYGQAVLDYLRGDQSQEQNNGGPLRNRSLLLGDIVDSNPLYIGPPPAVSGLSAPLGASAATQTVYGAAVNAYNAFYTANQGRTPAIYVGANSGLLYGFNATSGAPLFGYVPSSEYFDLANLSQPTYNQNHRFFVDGPANAGDVPFINSTNNTVTWHTVLAGGMGAGGQGIYALDVSSPSGQSSSDVLWDITNNTAGFSQLGLTYSQPQIAIMNINNSNGTPVPTPVAIFGNGYNSASSLPYLYVVNAQTGSLIHSFDLCTNSTGIEPAACSSSAPDGLSTPTVISTQGGDIADRAYAGDLQGNLWRFDMSSPNPANWTAWVLFKAAGPSGNAQPITTAPAVSRAPFGTAGYLVYFGTGQLLGTPDLTDTNTQSFYGVLDTGTNSGITTSAGNPQWLTRSALVSQTLTQTTYTGTNTSGNSVSKPVLTVTTNPVNYASTDGWYMDLPFSGGRVITNPSVFGQEVVFTANIPSTNVCGGGLESWLIAVNYATGSAFSSPMLDLNGDGLINSADQVNGQNPVGVSEGNVYSSAPVVTPTGTQSVKLISKSNSQIETQKERAGLQSGRVNWVELR